MKALITFCLLFLLAFSCAPVKDLELRAVDGFHLKSLEPKGMESQLVLKIANPNRYSFKILPSSFEVYYSEVYLGKAQLLNSVKIKGGEEGLYEFQLKNDFSKVNFFDLLGLLKPGAFKNEIRIKGELKAGKFLLRKSFPVDHKEKVSLD